MAEIKFGWAQHYYRDPYGDRYFMHTWHYYEHGRSLCGKSTLINIHQPFYKDWQEFDRLGCNICTRCLGQFIQGVHLPEYKWNDKVYEENKETDFILRHEAEREEKRRKLKAETKLDHLLVRNARISYFKFDNRPQVIKKLHVVFLKRRILCNANYPDAEEVIVHKGLDVSKLENECPRCQRLLAQIIEEDKVIKGKKE